MKSNVQNMESEMDRLTNNMSKITEQCATVNNALGPRREKIRQLNGVHNLLKKVCICFRRRCPLSHPHLKLTTPPAHPPP
ncbi:hypothetical protein BC936DRAFT_137536 [Jimgerdemannia flammicorona]|uniref:Vacuolar protein sorting-associated protein 51 homolog n=1 Tax=Jimgerdemannia flammicorona TaxID=994334 RepID=A0A433CX43_9FUNG|nr:hypothetical protein BC936DRAFT_137536 [Jimgerdemannia flammicorona]